MFPDIHRYTALPKARRTGGPSVVPVRDVNMVPVWEVDMMTVRDVDVPAHP